MPLSDADEARLKEFQDKFKRKNDDVALVQLHPDGSVKKRVVVTNAAAIRKKGEQPSPACEMNHWFMGELGLGLVTPEAILMPWEDERNGVDAYIELAKKKSDEAWAPLRGLYHFADGKHGTWTMPIDQAWEYVCLDAADSAADLKEATARMKRHAKTLLKELPHVEVPEELPRLALVV